MTAGRNPKPIRRRRVLIKAGYACNNNCAFCHSSPHRGHDSPTEALLSKIEAAGGMGAEGVVLSGGEPTIRKDLLTLVEAVARRGLRPGLVTNARALAYPGLVDALVGHGLDYVYLSLCGPDADTHDRLVRARAFDQTLKALAHLQGKVEEVTVNAIVLAGGLDRLPRFGDLLQALGPLRLKFSLVEPEGSVLEDFDGLVPSLERAAAAVCEAVEIIGRDQPDLPLAVDGFPLCVLPDLESLDTGLRDDGIFAMSEAFEAGFYPVDDAHRGFGRRCARCSLRRRCRGVFKTYLDRRGEDELRPVSRAVSNSFQIVSDGAPERFRVTACPVRAGREPPPDAVRGLLIQSKPGWARRARVDTRDFSDQSLRMALRDRGQAYLPAPELDQATDFASQLTRLELAATCGRCPRRDVCGGFHRASTRPAFEAARRLLDQRLGSLSGQVLDVGCGAAPYATAFEPALVAGQLEYVGIDPSLPAARTEGARTLLPQRLESFDWRGEPFDAIVALRSLNHLRDPLVGLRKMAALVKPEGRVLIAEDVVFGLVRTETQAARIAARPDLAYEHHLNLESGEVVGLAAEAGFRCCEEIGAERTGCTLWVLELQRG